MSRDLASRHEIRRSESRGHLRTDWLDARFSFSFGSYRDPLRMRFGPLLALNEDRVQPRTGFAMHPHRDLEILMIPLHGEIEHADSQGGQALVRPGDVQFMRAGSGIRHRQMNPSADAVDHHLQIWIEPRTPGLAPAVAQRQLRVGETSAWTCVASPDGRRDSFAVDADVVVEQATLAADARLDRPPSAGRWHYLHVVGGEVLARTEAGFEALLLSGDALLVLSDDEAVRLHGRAAATRLLAFDVAREDVERAR